MAEETDKLEKILKNFDVASEYWNPVYMRGQEDTNFAYGDQWDKDVRKDREVERRPCLTENRLLPFVHQVVNDIRQARPKIRPIPVDSGADVDTAEVLQGIIRNIEMQSDAESSYDTAAKNAVEAGIGWLRINTRYVDEMSFDQEICIERVINPFSIIIDPNHKRLDGADAEWCFIIDEMPLEDFEEMYPDADTKGFDEELATQGWITEDTVRVCEYYYRDYEKKTLVQTDLGMMYKDDMPEGVMAIQEREVEIPYIKYCKVTGTEILEEQDVLGKYIPIVPVVGEEAFQNGKREFYSLIHQAKDPQFMLNVWKSASTEIIGLQPKAPYIGAKGQFKSFASQWANANVKNYPFLQYDPVSNENGVPMPPPARQTPPTSSGSMMQEAMASAEAIKSTLGMYDASAGENTDDVSGKAIIARQMKGDNATFHFVDNLVTAMKHLGRIIVDLVPLVYDGARIIKILGEDGQEKMFPINQPIMRDGNGYAPMQAGGEMVKPFMMNAGKYDIDIDIGSNYATKRQEQANAIIELARVNPEVLSIAGDLLVNALDIPDGREIAKRIQSTMNPELLGDNPEAQRLQMLTQTIGQLEQQIAETEAALQIKDNNQQFENQMKLEELNIKKQELEIKAAEAAANVETKRIEVEAEAFKDYAQGQKDLSERIDDVTGAVDRILVHFEGMATDAPESSDNKE